MKTLELIGPQLDWTVAKCEGLYFEATESFLAYYYDGGMWYSSDWAQGGPIIEREKIDLLSYMERSNLEMSWRSCMKGVKAVYGPTPLIAAMRCYCCSKLGDEVEIPQELTNEVQNY